MKIKKTIIAMTMAVLMIVGSASSVFAASDNFSYNKWENRPFPSRTTDHSNTRSEATMLIQRIMYNKGMRDNNGGTISSDGYYGLKTSQAVLKFQESVKFKGNDLDGKVGPKTWGKLQSACTLDNGGPYTDGGSSYHKWQCNGSYSSSVVARHYNTGVWYYGDNTSNKIM